MDLYVLERLNYQLSQSTKNLPWLDRDDGGRYHLANGFSVEDIPGWASKAFRIEYPSQFITINDGELDSILVSRGYGAAYYEVDSVFGTRAEAESYAAMNYMHNPGYRISEAKGRGSLVRQIVS